MMTRRLFALCFAAVLGCLLYSPANAAEGKQARFSISMQVGDEFFALIRKQLKEQPGSDKAELQLLDEVMVPGRFTIPSVTGVLYYSAGRMRMDISMPDEQIATMIVDQPAGKLYLIDHKLRRADVADLGQFAQDQLGQGGMLVNPEMAALDWEAFLSQVKGSKGLKSKDLGSRKVSGLACHGIELSSTMGELTDAQELAAVPELPALIDPKSRWTGTMWMTDGLPVPVKFSSEMLGLSCIWQVLELNNWEGSDAFLAVPPGYRVQALDMSALTAPAKDG